MRITDKPDPRKKRNEEIVKLAMDGESYSSIGRRFGLTRSMISHIAISHGVVRRPADISEEKWAEKRSSDPKS